jgi:hypothetical protein
MLTIVSDLILTDSFLIKGQVENKYARLSQVFEEWPKAFLRIKDATLVDLGSRDRIQTPLVHVNMEEILVAHEFLDSTSDPTLAKMAADTPARTNRVRVFYTGALNVEVAGHVRPGAYELDDKNSNKFFVMTNPELRGMNLEGDRDLETLTRLDWVILNKRRLSYVYDFS